MMQVLSDYDSAESAALTDQRRASFLRSTIPPAPICASGCRGRFSSTISIPKSPPRSRKRSRSSPASTHEIRDITLEVSTDRTLASAEAYAYHKEFVDRSPELYQPATLARIRSGANISAHDALRASRDLQASRHAIQEIFHEVDVLLTPTVPIPPPLIADLREHPDNLRSQELIMLRNTRPFNVWGIPTVSVPCGFTKDGLPIGLQLAAAPWHGMFCCRRHMPTSKRRSGIRKRQMYQFAGEPHHCIYPLTLSP